MKRELPMAVSAPADLMALDEQEARTAQGLRHANWRVDVLAERVLTAAAQVGAVVEVLRERGLLDDEELAARQAAEEQRLGALFRGVPAGIHLNTDKQDADKYAIPADALPDIDCADRYHLCHGACCALRFALTPQDLDEGTIRWEFGAPYMIRHGEDGACVHQDRATHRCTVYERRPAICRTYSCRHDARIWDDFERRIINPRLFTVLPDGRLRPQFALRPTSASLGPDEADAVPKAMVRLDSSGSYRADIRTLRGLLAEKRAGYVRISLAMHGKVLVEVLLREQDCQVVGFMASPGPWWIFRDVFMGGDGKRGLPQGATYHLFPANGDHASLGVYRRVFGRDAYRHLGELRGYNGGAGDATLAHLALIAVAVGDAIRSIDVEQDVARYLNGAAAYQPRAPL